MPQVVAGALAPLLLSIGVPAQIVSAVALCPSGAEAAAVDDGLWLEHVWPHNAKTRTELVARLCHRTESSPWLKSHVDLVVNELAKLADRPLDDLIALRDTLNLPVETSVEMAIMPAMEPLRREMYRDEGGLFEELLAQGHWPHMAIGLCLEPVISEGSLMFSNSRLDIRKGDLVAYVAKGLSTMGCKVFLGEANGRVFFWCNQPAAVYSFAYDQLIHVSRVSRIKQPGQPIIDARSLDFRPFLSPSGRMVLERTDDLPFIGPKEKDIFTGLEKAFHGIWEALAALPAGGSKLALGSGK